MIHEKIQALFRDFFEDESLILEPSMTAEDIDGWDSLAHIQLVSMIQQEFKIRFTLNEIMRLKDINTLLSLVASKYEH